MSDENYKISSFRSVEIMQEDEYGFTPDVCKELIDNWSSIKEAAFIHHDKDENTNSHCHLMIKFNGVVPTSAIINKVNKIAGCECIKFQHLEKIKKSWEDALAYLCHWKEPQKYQYDKSEVYSNFNWEELAKTAISPIKDKKLLNYINLINDGVLCRYNYMDFMPIDEYTSYLSKLEKAWKYKDECKARELRNKDFNMNVIFITGNSASFKTTLAKKICRSKSLEYSISSSSNDPFQDYKGEPAFILDDLRGNSIFAADLFKILDHNTRSSCSSRFFNKFLFTDLIIITSVQDIDSFFKDLSIKNNEPNIQLFRRCNIYIKMSKEYIRIYEYNDIKKDYSFICSYENKLDQELHIIPFSENNKKNTINYFNSVFNSSGNSVGIDDSHYIDISPEDLKEINSIFKGVL